jgi:hypothetical protein
MKNIKKAALLFTLLAVFVAGAGRASAYDRDRSYTYGHNGYWDHGHHYHHWDHYNGHDGYWHRRDDGVRVFIDI